MENCEIHDHYKGECLVIHWKGSVQEREGYERKEALAHMTQDEQQEYIRNINKINRAKVAKANIAPF